MEERMRFIGLVLLVACAIALPLLIPAWGHMLANPWYLVAVLVGTTGALLVAYKPAAVVRSWVLFLRAGKGSADEHLFFARMHEMAARQALAAGLFAMLVGWIANFGTNEPPLVADFARSLTAPAFALVFGAVVHRPLAAWHRNKAGD